MSKTIGALPTIRVLFRQSDTMTLWGIPYAMRTDVGQAPRDLLMAEWKYGKHAPKSSGSPPADWIYLGSPGSFRGLSETDARAVEAWLAPLKAQDLIPLGPNEWSDVETVDCALCNRTVRLVDSYSPADEALCATCDAEVKENKPAGGAHEDHDEETGE